MGISGLWDELRSASKPTSPHILAKEGYLRRDGLQSLRVGVDASIWLVQGRAADRPELANGTMLTFFHKLCKLWNLGLSVILIFDGPHRPSSKRGGYVAGKAMPYEQQVRQIADAFGFLHYKAPGEAEAELALLSSMGLIDAVITDDGDALVFGATRLIRNWGAGLSGSEAQRAYDKKEEAKKNPKDEAAFRNAVKKEWVTVYDMQEVKRKLSLDQNGLVLIALMSGGDYAPAGVDGCGHTTSAALAKAGFGEELVEAYRDRENDPEGFRDFLYDWRQRLKEELATNSLGLMKTRKKALADNISVHFPDLKILSQYVEPTTSATMDVADPNFTGYDFDWTRQMSVSKLVAFMHAHLEFPHAAILKNFVGQIVPGYMLYNLRCRNMELDAARRGFARPKILPLTKIPIKITDDTDDGLCRTITRDRAADSTGGLTEYRLQVDPSQLFGKVRQRLQSLDDNTERFEMRKAAAKEAHARTCASQGIQMHSSEILGDVDDDSQDEDSSAKKSGAKKKAVEPPGSMQLLWIAGHLLRPCCADLIEHYEDKKEAKAQAKTTKGKGKAKVSPAKATPTAKTSQKSKLQSNADSSPITSISKHSRNLPASTESQTVLQWTHDDSVASDLSFQISVSPPNMPKNAKSKAAVIDPAPWNMPKYEESRQTPPSSSSQVIDLTSSPTAPTLVAKEKTQSKAKSSRSLSPDLLTQLANKSPRKNRNQAVARAKYDSDEEDEELPDVASLPRLRPSLLAFTSTKPALVKNRLADKTKGGNFGLVAKPKMGTLKKASPVSLALPHYSQVASQKEVKRLISTPTDH